MVYTSGKSRGGPRASSLFLDQAEAQREENNFFGDSFPSLSQGLDDWASYLSEGLDLPLYIGKGLDLRASGQSLPVWNFVCSD